MLSAERWGAENKLIMTHRWGVTYLSRAFHYVTVTLRCFTPLFSILVISMDARLRRVNKEITGMFNPISWSDISSAKKLQDCKNDKSSQIKIDLIDESPFHLKGSFPGPQETPYEGGHFEVVRYYLVFFVYHLRRSCATTTGHRNPRIISIPTSEDEVYYQSLPSQHFFCLWRDLSRYPQRCLVPSFDA
jgi:hypothetical protein